MHNIIAKYLEIYPASYVFAQLAKASARVAENRGTDGEASDLECELFNKLHSLIPFFVVEFRRDGHTWESDKGKFPNADEARHYGTFCEKEDRFGTLSYQVLRYQDGQATAA